MYMYVYEYLRAMFGHEGKRIYPSVRVRGILYLPGTEADEYPVELKRSKPPSCCGRWVLHDKQASLSCSTGSPFRWWRNRTRVPPCPPENARMWICVCAPACLCECVCVRKPNCLIWASRCVSHGFGNFCVFRLKVTSLRGFSTPVCTLCESSYRMCVCCTYADNYTSVSRGKPVSRMESVFEPTLHKCTISGYGSDSNYGKHVGKN